MGQQESSEPGTRRARRDALTNEPTPFDGALLIKPPALRGVSDFETSPLKFGAPAPARHTEQSSW